MSSHDLNEDRIRQYLFEDISEVDNLIVEPPSDHDDEDHVSVSDHDTNTTVDDSDADPDFVPSEEELSDVNDLMEIDELGPHEEIMDAVENVQEEAVTSRNDSGNILSTIDTVIEAVVGGLGGQDANTSISSRNRNVFISKDKLVRWKKLVSNVMFVQGV